MTQIWNIFKIFANIFFKDKVNLFMIFFFNAFLMVVFGMAIEDRYNVNIDLGIADLANTDESIKAKEYLENQPNVTLLSFRDKDELLTEVQLGKVVAGIVINSSAADNTLDIHLVGDTSRKMWLEFLDSMLKLSVFSKEELEERVNVETVLVQSNNLTYFDFIFPGLLIFSIMQVGLSGGIMLLVQRKNDSLKRLQITPLKKWQFLVGYISCYFCIMVMQVLAYIALANILFKYVFLGNLWNIVIILLFSCIFFIALGVLLCNFCNTVENGNNFNRFFIFPASFLCGVFIPVSTFPLFIQKISLIHPLTYLVNIMRDISNYDVSLWNYSVLLGVFTIVLLTIVCLGVITFKWQQKTA